MHQPHSAKRYEPRRTWAVILIACVTLIATSAPKTAQVSAHASEAALEGRSDLVVHISEDGVRDSTSIRVRFSVKSLLAREESPSSRAKVTARFVPTDARLRVIEVPLMLARNSNDQLVAKGYVDALAACPDEKACDLGFHFELVPSRNYELTVTGDIYNANNNMGGCLFGNPSYSEDATITASFK